MSKVGIAGMAQAASETIGTIEVGDGTSARYVGDGFFILNQLDEGIMQNLVTNVEGLRAIVAAYDAVS